MYKHKIENQKREVRALQPLERKRLLEVADNTGLGGITEKKRVTVRVLMHTGMRAAELSHLRLSWLDDSEDIPMVRIPGLEPCDCSYCQKQVRRNVDRNKSKPDDGDDGFEAAVASDLAEYWKPKSQDGARPIPVHYPETWDLLVRHLEEHGDGDDPQFDVGTYAIWKRVKAVNEHMDLEHDVTPHVLRHTFCAMFAENGEQLGNIAEMAGHASVDTTRRYAKMTGHVVARQTAENAPRY